jgi:hypothetical protein
MNCKSNAPIIAVALLLVVSVVSVSSFNSWFDSFNSDVLSDVEKRSSHNSMMRVDGIIGDTLYLYSEQEIELDSLKIYNNNFDVNCEVVFSEEEFLTDGLVAYYPLKNDSNDYSGNENHGTIYNNVTFNGEYAEFDGVEDYITISHNPTIDFDYNDNFTLIARVNVKDVYYFERASVIYKGVFINSSGISFRFDGFNLGARVSLQDPLPNYFRVSYHINYDNWMHLVLVAKDKFFYAYVDGKFVGEVNYSDATDFSNTDDWQIGNIGGIAGSQGYYNWSQKDTRIYNRALNNNEIFKLYNYRGNSMILRKDINDFDISNCNIVKGEKYNIVAFTDENKIETEVISR